MKRILLAEDGLALQVVLKEFLTGEGYCVEVVGNGRLALNFLEMGLKVDALVTDQNMPHMKGLELLEAIREHSALKSLPVVVFSTDSYEQFVKRVNELGGFHAAKPSVERLEEAIEKALEWGQQKRDTT